MCEMAGGSEGPERFSSVSGGRDATCTKHV